MIKNLNEGISVYFLVYDKNISFRGIIFIIVYL